MSKKLLDCEWTILRALWGKPPQGLKDIIAGVRQQEPQIKWQYKTYHSYLRVMIGKGLIGCDIVSARDKRYFALITREQALRSESASLLSRVSMDSMGRLVALMAQQGQISDRDRQELSALFDRLSKEDGDRDGH
ncbi:MAG: BlaI/MecI/CopY family transcriptional regulator [Eubacteriales bacterium]|nr:BlaI/MecI/CopY family transcriptional regulator [Eubacteriales bacterium]